MHSLPVVEHLDVFRNGEPRTAAGMDQVVVVHLIFQCRDERFRCCVVLANTCPAYAPTDTDLLAKFREILASVLCKFNRSLQHGVIGVRVVGR